MAQTINMSIILIELHEKVILFQVQTRFSQNSFNFNMPFDRINNNFSPQQCIQSYL